MRIALLAYRGNPHSGGQGVYVRHLSRALARLGHRVEVLSGPPYPDLAPEVPLTRLESLDLYRPDDPFRRARPIRGAIDLLEFGTMCVGGFPEPLTFSLRAWRHLRRRTEDFDVVHDNQSLAYGLLAIERAGLPVVATVHHPIAIDRRLELAAAPGWQRRTALRRWYSFVRMQRRVAPRLRRVITVSTQARDDIVQELGVARERAAVIPNGVDATTFRPLPGRRIPGRVLTTASADVPLKGLVSLLEAMARVRGNGAPGAELVVVGKARPNGAASAAIARFGLQNSVRFVTGVEESELVRLYSEAEVAVVPSLYEGFSLPAVEAMACAVPVVATTAGALPEVIGRDGETGFLVPPGDPPALARAISRALEDRDLSRRLGASGRARVLERFSWERAAQATVEQYRQAIGQC
ncbi:MAG TPA: glycosyltransferase family 4 protein [Candidatus Dormibacteraeota bacterium]